MSDHHEAFFTPTERKATVILRPKEWRQWWHAEPLVTKILAGGFAVALVCGVYEELWGNKDLGWVLVTVVLLLFVLLLVGSLAAAFGATVRWLLRRFGLLDETRRLVKQAKEIGVALFWIGVAIAILANFWPYVSLDPAKSWYALRHMVPVENVVMEKKPHDCDFTAAPLGDKNCHYEAQFYVTKNGDGPKQRALIVSYEKVQD